jgi:hypothetical protein
VTTRIIENDIDKASAIELIKHMEAPLTLTIEKGRKRSCEQNRLQHLWHKEAAEQLLDGSAEEKRGYCKLHFGVPIMRENDEFREAYDKVIMPLQYELKILSMQSPLDFPVTSLMTVKQKSAFLDQIYVFYTGLGVKLTEPSE